MPNNGQRTSLSPVEVESQARRDVRSELASQLSTPTQVLAGRLAGRLALFLRASPSCRSPPPRADNRLLACRWVQKEESGGQASSRLLTYSVHSSTRTDD